jgi:hypothetical protein
VSSCPDGKYQVSIQAVDHHHPFFRELHSALHNAIEEYLFFPFA